MADTSTDDPNAYESYELNWQFYSRMGNQQMQANFYVDAQRSYRHALELAELMLLAAQDHPDVVHPYVVSHHNLADCLIQLGNMQQADGVLRQVFDRIIELMNDETMTMELRFEALRALRATSFERYQFYHESEQTSKAEEVMQQAMARSTDFISQYGSTSMRS
jgi:tetratricopeptide (TPR) repeat protein